MIWYQEVPAVKVSKPLYICMVLEWNKSMNILGWAILIATTYLFKCFPGFETLSKSSNQYELMGTAARKIEIGAKLSAVRQIESEEVKCLREIMSNWEYSRI
jgi:hypothetical protein